MAHNPEVAGSNPAPLLGKRPRDLLSRDRFLRLVTKLLVTSRLRSLGAWPRSILGAPVTMLAQAERGSCRDEVSDGAEAGILARGRRPGYRPVSLGSWAGRWLPTSR